MNNLRNICKKKGITIKKLHELTGYPTRTIEDWFANKAPIRDYHRIKRLSEVLECDMDDIMVFEEKCLYDGKEAILIMIQEDHGVNVLVVDDEADVLASNILERPLALEIIKHLRKTGVVEILEPRCYNAHR